MDITEFSLWQMILAYITAICLFVGFALMVPGLVLWGLKKEIGPKITRVGAGFALACFLLAPIALKRYLIFLWMVILLFVIEPLIRRYIKKMKKATDE